MNQVHTLTVPHKQFGYLCSFPGFTEKTGTSRSKCKIGVLEATENRKEQN